MTHDDPATTVCYTISHPEFGDVAAVRTADGKSWMCARDYIDAYAGAVTNGFLSGFGTCPEDLAHDIFKKVPARFKAVKRFRTPEGFQDLLGITPEGLRFFHDLNDQLYNDAGPVLQLVK